MTFIWYNPDLDNYQQGSEEEYTALIKSSKNKDRFDILYEFNETNMRLVNKVLGSLNRVRQIQSGIPVTH